MYFKQWYFESTPDEAANYPIVSVGVSVCPTLPSYHPSLPLHDLPYTPS